MLGGGAVDVRLVAYFGFKRVDDLVDGVELADMGTFAGGVGDDGSFTGGVAGVVEEVGGSPVEAADVVDENLPRRLAGDGLAVVVWSGRLADGGDGFVVVWSGRLDGVGVDGWESVAAWRTAGGSFDGVEVAGSFEAWRAAGGSFDFVDFVVCFVRELVGGWWFGRGSSGGVSYGVCLDYLAGLHLGAG